MSAWATGGGKLTATVATGAAGTVIKKDAGRLARVLVTTTGTASNPLLFYDNPSAASGTVIGSIPGNAAAGSVYDLEMPAQAGIYAQNVANGPAVTVSYE